MTAMDIAIQSGKHVHLQGHTYATGTLSYDPSTGLYVLKRDNYSGERLVFDQADVTEVKYQSCVYITVTKLSRLR